MVTRQDHQSDFGPHNKQMFYFGGKEKVSLRINRALMLVSEDGKFADALIRRNAGADLMTPGAPTHSSSFSKIKEQDLLKEFAAGGLWKRTAQEHF